MTAFFKREFLSYFRSPVGYVAIALFSFLSGFIFYSQFASGSVDIASEVISLRSFFVIIVPIITMGLLSEDKKRGTDILYYTTPVNLFNVTLICGGKFGVGSVGAVIVFFFMAFMFISIGLFASAITDNQIISAIVAFIFILISQLLSTIAQYAGTAVVSILGIMKIKNAEPIGRAFNTTISWLDPFEKTKDFRLGLFSVSALFFLFSIGLLFLYFTFRILEKKRWSQA